MGKIMHLHGWLGMAKQYGPLLLWGTAALVVTLAVARGMWNMGRGGTATEARWASRRDLRKAYLLGTRGIVLGRIGTMILRYWGRGHVFIVAATQSGKSRSLVTTTLLESQPGTSILVHDPKGELYACTATYRSTVSRVLHIAPCDPASDHYNPIDAIRIGTVHETADLQVLSGILGNPEGLTLESEGAKHYVDMTEILIRGLVLYGLTEGGQTSLGELYMLVTQGSLHAACEAMRTSAHTVVRQAGEMVADMDEKQYSGVVTTLSRAFTLYGDPLIGDMVSYSDFSLAALREESQPVTIYLSVPFAHLERCTPLIRLLLRQWLGYATDVPQNWRKQGWHKLLVMGEEFPSLKRISIVADILNHGAGLGVQLCLISPSMNDIEAIWGTKHNFNDNSHVQAFFGLTDERIAERVSKRLGTNTVWTKRVGSNGGRRSVSWEKHKEPLMSSSDITHMDPNDVLLLARNYQVVVQQTPWDKSQPWKSRGVNV